MSYKMIQQHSEGSTDEAHQGAAQEPLSATAASFWARAFGKAAEECQ